jgi:hypothetical protein
VLFSPLSEARFHWRADSEFGGKNQKMRPKPNKPRKTRKNLWKPNKSG